MDPQVLQMQAQMRQFVASQQAESRRLGRQLHDELGQLLAALCMRLHLACDAPAPNVRPQLEECLTIAEQAIDQVRELSLDLSPAMLDDTPLPDVVREYLSRRCSRAGLTANLVTSSSWMTLPPEIEATCLRVIQEAMGNIIRHAAAEHVQLELRQDSEAVHLCVRDDGTGFDPTSLELRGEPPQTLGLPAMRQRVELLGGSWTIKTLPGQGTTIRVCLPMVDGSGTLDSPG